MATYRQRFTGAGRFGIGLFIGGPSLAIVGGVMEVGGDPVIGHPPEAGLVLIALGLILAYAALPFLIVGREFRQIEE